MMVASLAEVPVYVMHYKGAPERKAFMQSQLQQVGFQDIRYVEVDDREELSPEKLAYFYNDDPVCWVKKVETLKTILIENSQFNPNKPSWQSGVNYDFPVPTPRRLTGSEISLAIKHIYALSAIAADKQPGSEQAASLVLEDDTVLSERFNELLQSALQSMPKDWQILFLGDGCGLRVPGRSDQAALYRMDPPRGKCSDAYLINVAAAKAILKTLVPFSLPIDFELGCSMLQLQTVCYWLEPPITTQGSQTGMFPSLLR
jgi:GR25 family glycosyltransferase involved in LPS biosynthesis